LPTSEAPTGKALAGSGRGRFEPPRKGGGRGCASGGGARGSAAAGGWQMPAPWRGRRRQGSGGRERTRGRESRRPGYWGSTGRARRQAGRSVAPLLVAGTRHGGHADLGSGTVASVVATSRSAAEGREVSKHFQVPCF
jgi:hypothetical protein